MSDNITQSIADAIDNAVAPVSDFVSSVIFYAPEIFGVQIPLVVLWLIAAATVLTFHLRFVNLTGFGHALALVSGRERRHLDGGGEISHFQALSSALSGTVGLGNIASVPVAIAIGGPGAVFWMILAGFLGMSSKFAECALAVKYRRIGPNGQTIGGPMFYIEKAFADVGLKGLGKPAAIFFAMVGTLIPAVQFAGLIHPVSSLEGMGRWIGERLNAMEGPVRFLLPEGGVSALDAPGKPFHDPGADAALFDDRVVRARKSGACEEILDVTEAAGFAVELIFTLS